MKASLESHGGLFFYAFHPTCDARTDWGSCARTGSTAVRLPVAGAGLGQPLPTVPHTSSLI